LGYYCGN